MSYIVKTTNESGELYEFYNSTENAFSAADDQVRLMKQEELSGTVTITKDGEVIREYKVGEQE